ncbi:heme ABC transporter ATP-binding protein [Stenotrophobium rhamnosiphilum]|uniref:Heme ABC transporter ATP-binding protein n=1 Tax=Stenotrophobium rhamnosiphilum TaxID=2029166 RepID=A0A2T5MH98_9GAMM|nr:heme ABC transporter ATP-binding protein [Stenotrophobium rhamnosiphilum]PTU31943.1 heme ABC transporter ATP-binding protein [Stenotrophobium rhamnosiphilum]
MSLRAVDVSSRIGTRTLLNQVSVNVEPGRVHAVLGPNGAGKSTLLKLLSGEQRATSGQVLLEDRDIKAWPAMERARRRAVLPQSESLSFDFTVRQVVSLGRMPCQLQTPTREREIISAALEATGVLNFDERLYPTLSGGERMRVQLARVLAQIWESADHPRYLLLDEPTASLDLAHQHSCLRLARRFAAEGTGVLLVLHDPNLALTYADDVTLLCCGQIVAQGSPAQVLTQKHLEHVYGVKIDILHSPTTQKPFIAVHS